MTVQSRHRLPMRALNRHTKPSSKSHTMLPAPAHQQPPRLPMNSPLKQGQPRPRRNLQSRRRQRQPPRTPAPQLQQRQRLSMTSQLKNSQPGSRRQYLQQTHQQQQPQRTSRLLMLQTHRQHLRMLNQRQQALTAVRLTAARPRHRTMSLRRHARPTGCGISQWQNNNTKS